MRRGLGFFALKLEMHQLTKLCNTIGLFLFMLAEGDFAKVHSLFFAVIG